MDTLIAEDLLLLLLDDDSGKLTSTYLDIAIGGALLVELTLAGTVAVTEGHGLWSRDKVVATDAATPSDPLLADSLDMVRLRDRSAQDLVGRLGKKRRDPLLERLERRGVLRLEEDKVLGLFPRKRWPAIDSSHETDLRRHIGDALVRGLQPDERTAALIALLSALGVVSKVVDREGLSASEVKKRAKAVAQGDWAAKAVKDAVAAAQAAVTASVVAATAATTASS